MPTAEDILIACGGSPRIEGGENVWNFGFAASRPEITAAVVRDHDPTEDVPQLVGDRVCLFKYAQFINGGKHPRYSYQRTGSCVNSGSNNSLTSLEGIVCALRGVPGEFRYPFTLSAYGLSRYLAFGQDSEGEGSSGDAIAQALQQMGWCAQDLDAMPTRDIYDNAIAYAAEVEMEYSRMSFTSDKIKTACTGHKLDFIAIKTCDQAEIEIRRGRPLSWAGNWGSSMRMGYKSSGTNKVLFGEHSSSWEHQQSVHAVWIHPELGRLWYIMNNWYQVSGEHAEPVHGQPATDEPPGGYWVDDSAMQHQLDYKFGEVRAYCSTTPYSDKLNVLSV
jgi:hypothetical protein